MDDKLLKKTAIKSIIFLLCIIVLSIYITKNNTLADIQYQQDLSQEAIKESLNNIANEKEDASIIKKLNTKYLLIKKPKNSWFKVELEDLYMNNSIQVSLTGLHAAQIDENSISSVNNGMKFIGKPKKLTIQRYNREDRNKLGASSYESKSKNKYHNSNDGLNRNNDILLTPQLITAAGYITDYDTSYVQKNITDPIIDVNIQHKEIINSSLSKLAMNLSFDELYAYKTYQDKNYVYIDLRKPKEIYDKILVIDAGHGGKDSGAYSYGRTNYEKDVNLSLMLKIKQLLDKTDIKVYYTRMDDRTVYLNPRVDLANDVEADMFISIHCNSNDSAIPYGTEILYNEKDDTSKQLAEISLVEMTNIRNRVNRGLVPASEMVIIGNSDVPIALIEVAFISNKDDLEFLLDESNQNKIANSIYTVIQRAYKELKIK